MAKRRVPPLEEPRAPGSPRLPPPTGSGRHRSTIRRAIAVVAVTAAIVSAPSAAHLVSFGERVADGALLQPVVAPFYTAATPPPEEAAPGTIVRTERVVAAPPGARAWRILYHSADAGGADSVVSGLVVAPDAPANGGPRTIVSWAHPTTGTAPRCAPSRGIDPFILIEGLADLLAAGHIVVATDYSGMGIDGPPSFLIGDTEGANVLDIARAARAIEWIGAGNRVILWGHSQGGQAALFAAQRAAGYAPELSIAGVAVAAPATDLGALFKADEGDVAGVTIGAYAFDSWAEAYPARLPHAAPFAGILSAAGAAAVPRMAKLCLFGQNRELHTIAAPLVGSFLTADPSTAPGWGAILAGNTPGRGPLPVPLFVAQGAKDTLVRPDITAAFVAAQKEAGTVVESHVLADSTHGTVALDAMPELMAWMRALP